LAQAQAGSPLPREFTLLHLLSKEPAQDMMCRSAVAVFALVAGASASGLNEPIVIDSEGHIASVIRRETPKRHLHRQDPTGDSKADTKEASAPAVAKADVAKVAAPATTAIDAPKADATASKPAGGKDEKAKSVTVIAPPAVSDTPAATPGGEADKAKSDVVAAAPTAADTSVAKPAGADSEDVAPVAPVITAPRSVKKALARSDLKYSFVEESDSSACNSHFEFKGDLTNAQCAERCYNTFGCARFSAGGCSLGCRISVSGANNPAKVASPHDGQCPTSKAAPASECVTYKLAFFNAQKTQGSCSAHYQFIASAKNAAECAHACKNTPGCKKFSAEPNCMGGCRISKCGANAKASDCPSDGQCAVSDDAKIMCTAYDLTTADSPTK